MQRKVVTIGVGLSFLFLANLAVASHLSSLMSNYLDTFPDAVGLHITTDPNTPAGDDLVVAVVDANGNVLDAATFDGEGNIIMGIGIEEGLPLGDFIADRQLSIGTNCSTFIVCNGIMDQLRTVMTPHIGPL